MSRTITATELRSHLYRMLDEVIRTGEPIRIERSEGSVLLVPADRPRRALDGLALRPVITCSPDEIVETSFPWSPPEGE
jgi:antitoxin (DNA-binding transcriptional repressor) of toxin-antitoxin stability system